MEEWEYLTEFCYAHSQNPGWEEYRKENWPRFQPEKFAPETMIPRLNQRGAAGWELVHMEPVDVGKNKDVRVHQTGDMAISYWSNVYFCVFKRRVTS